MTARPVVQVVLLVDTEGPAVDPKAGIYGTWEEIGAAVDRLSAPSFRRAVPDPDGREAAVTWFILDWTGFRTNPVQRDMGYHKVLDRFRGFLRDVPQDSTGWHYHHPPVDGVGNHWNPDWSTRPPWHEAFEYETILHRKILERAWFPNVFRAGATIESNETSNWLERWIPFDYSSRAPLKVDDVTDWSAAPVHWDYYHPSAEDYRKPGRLRRCLARSLDAGSRLYAITQEEVDRAFEHARSRGGAILSSFTHDYRDLATPFLGFLEKLRRAAARFPDVTWKYAGAAQAIQERRGWTGVPPLALEARPTGPHWILRSSQELLGPVPWTCVERGDGRISGTPVPERVGPREWTLPRPVLEGARRLGVAANTEQGATGVLVVDATV